jgi:hypothetical protein
MKMSRLEEKQSALLRDCVSWRTMQYNWATLPNKLCLRYAPTSIHFTCIVLRIIRVLKFVRVCVTLVKLKLHLLFLSCLPLNSTYGFVWMTKESERKES